MDPETLEAFVDDLPLARVPILLENLVTRNDKSFENLTSQFVSRWANENAPATAAWAGQLLDPAFHALACEQVAIAWVQQDSSAATDWILSLPEGESRSAAIQAAAYEISRSDPVAALELAIELPASSGRDELLAHAVSQWAVISANEAAGWVNQIPDEDLRTRLIAAVAVALAKHDPAAAASLVSSNIPLGEQQNRAAVLVASQWAQIWPEQATAWVQQFPEGPVRNAAREALAEIRN